MKADSKEIVVLLVEDSPEDYEVTKRAFVKLGLKHKLVHCEDGDDALDYLFRRNAYAHLDDSARPRVILLDLNLPGTDGRGVLEIVKTHPDLKTIPVIMLTTSNNKNDVESCYALGANSYVQKPVSLPGFMDAIQRLNDFWFSVSLLPENNSATPTGH